MQMKNVAPFLLTLTLVFGPSLAQAEPIVGLTTSNEIFFFDSANPNSIGPLVPVTGLLPGTSLVGIDFRPAVPGQLTGVGQTGTSGAVYRIDPSTGVATQVNTIPVLMGTEFGVDFNPVPDALRIVSDAEQNLRITLGGAGVVNTDGVLNPGDPNVVGAAYANNVPGGVGGQTTLYEIDSVLDTLFTQGGVNFPPGTPPVSPNTGTLFPVGPLGVNFTDLVGFDISGFTGTAFASLTDGAGGADLYTINLSTGAATLVGAIDGSTFEVRDISVSPVPEPATLLLFGAGAAGLFGAAARRRRGLAPEA